MKNIHIPEPCHENWADFTPTQKGAFCGSCQIDVVDFSNKTPDQVKAILKENAGKHMCGRFRKSQLDDLNADYTQWENQSYQMFQSKFLYACLIVFGMTLFTSCTTSEQNFLSNFGIEHSNESIAQNDLTKSAAFNVEKDSNKVNKNEWRHIKGKVKFDPIQEEVDENTNCAVPDSTVNENEYVKGDFAVVPDIEILGNFVAPPVEDTVKQVIVEQDTLFDDMMIDGEMFIPEDIVLYVDDTTTMTVIEAIPEDTDTSYTCVIEGTDTDDPITEDVPADTISNQIVSDTEGVIASSLSNIPPAFEMIFDCKVFPNPVHDQTHVVVNVHKSELFNIYLYAIDGKRVKNIFNGILNTGRTEFLIDLSAYEAGSYLIVVNGQNQKESLRVEKVE